MQATVWKAFLDDIVEQQSKLKRFDNEDILRGLSKLTSLEVQAFIGWVQTEGRDKRVFPAKQMNAVTITLRNTLVFAAQAQQYVRMNVRP
jgi:uncharacterized damage-inducible protein DinB